MQEWYDAIKSADSIDKIEEIRIAVFGKKGIMNAEFARMKDIPDAEKGIFAKELNIHKEGLNALLLDRKLFLAMEHLQATMKSEAIDVSLYSATTERGSLHPVMETMDRIVEYFIAMNFSVQTGPMVEDDFHNFEALNLPKYHPARDMQDTFYFKDAMLLRTHTSPVQVRYMEANQPPLKIISSGRVYRVDSDATHSPMFHQVEGLWVDEEISFANLKGVVQDFLQRFFERDDLQVRFRPSFFPFTEPSAEMDMSWNGGWLEIGGCGMVHPNVLKHVNIDSEKYLGFAFGLGVERLAMLRYGVNDLRQFYESDLRFLKQFN